MIKQPGARLAFTKRSVFFKTIVVFSVYCINSSYCIRHVFKRRRACGGDPRPAITGDKVKKYEKKILYYENLSR